MTKDEAKDWIGKPVTAWTALQGSYAGVLMEVISRPGRPWRGKVKIAAQLQPANKGYLTHRPGKIIEVGHSSIKPWGKTDWRQDDNVRPRSNG